MDLKLTKKDFFLNNKIIIITTIIAIVFNLFIYLYLYYKIDILEPVIALYYNVYFGVNKLGSVNKLFYLPFIGTFIITTNMIIGILVYKREKVLSYLLVTTSLICQLLLFIVLYFIILLNS